MTQALVREPAQSGSDPASPTRRHLLGAVAAGLAAVALGVGPRLPAPVGPRAAAAALAFVSLCAESLPFLLAGSCLAFLLRGRGQTLVLAAARRNRWLAIGLAPLMGLALPLCDCAVVPLARELRDAGLPGRMVTAFAAGTPLTNPIVIGSTALAFGGSLVMVVGRLVVGIAVALAAAAFGPPAPLAGSGDIDHHHAGGIIASVAAELAESGPPLVFGALAAGAIRGLLPSLDLSLLVRQPLLGALAMMALAMVLSLCSQADAFVAASLPVGTLGQLAFLVVGPTSSLRLAAVYRRSFGTPWVLRFVRTTLIAAFVLCSTWVALVPR
jgi:uncharacterized protein